MKTLKKSKLTQLWLTTKTHEKYDLENELETSSYFLKFLSHEEKVSFLSAYWKYNLKKFFEDSESTKDRSEYTTKLKEIVTNYDLIIEQNFITVQNKEELSALKRTIDKLHLEQFTEGMLVKFSEKLKENLQKNEEFTSSPHNLKMLAEVIFKKKFQAIETLGLFDLYRTFTKMKFDLYRREKTLGYGNEAESVSSDIHKNASRRVHLQLALRLLFEEEYTKKNIKIQLPGLDALDRFREDIGNNRKAEEELARIGLLSLHGDELRFLHRSFSEYFLSEYVMQNFQNERIQKLFVEKILCYNDYSLLRIFINEELKDRNIVLTKK